MAATNVEEGVSCTEDNTLNEACVHLYLAALNVAQQNLDEVYLRYLHSRRMNLQLHIINGVRNLMIANRRLLLDLGLQAHEVGINMPATDAANDATDSSGQSGNVFVHSVDPQELGSASSAQDFAQAKALRKAMSDTSHALQPERLGAPGVSPYRHVINTVLELNRCLNDVVQFGSETPATKVDEANDKDD